MPTLLRTISPLNPFNPFPTKHTKNSITMTSQPTPHLMPYRDTNNTSVAYTTAPNPNAGNPVHINPYDSDFEPLINAPSNVEVLDEDSMMRFTATGRPMPSFKQSARQSMGGDMFSLPQLLPKRYTDDSIIPAIVVDIIPSQKTIEEQERKKAKNSFMRKLKGEAKKDESKGLTRVVYMPRREYLKWFARDLEGKYIGTEPYKRWEEDELEATFAQYKPVVVKRKGYTPPY